METKRIKHWINQFPDSVLWIIAGNREQAEVYAMALKDNGIRSEMRVFSQSKTTIDGLNSESAIILLCENWWKNPAANTDTFRYYMDNARYVMQMGEITPPDQKTAANINVKVSLDKAEMERIIETVIDQLREEMKRG